MLRKATALVVGSLALACANTLAPANGERRESEAPQLVSEVVPLAFAPARLLARDIQALAAAAPRSLGEQVQVTVDERANTLALTCPRELLSLVRMRIAEEDRARQARWEHGCLRVVPLAHARANELAELLDGLLRGARREQSLLQDHPERRDLPSGRTQEFMDTATGILSVEPDWRTNALVVVSDSPVDLSRVLELIARLDVEAKKSP